MSTAPVVAIDGPVGVGKSSVARTVADHLGFRHLDTGAMYRCVALARMRLVEAEGADVAPERVARMARDLDIDLREDGSVYLGGEDVGEAIRAEEVSREVARVADNRAVREALVEQQRRIGLQRPSVLEGRDIGTVVFPDAHWKYYLDASPQVRADRRASQLEEMGLSRPSEEILHNLLERDRRDRARPWGALRVAEDATLVDTTGLSFDRVVDLICCLVREDPCPALASHAAVS
ncbi:MAG: (d)CMP kinase [Sumerlaeia bacterium]